MSVNKALDSILEKNLDEMRTQFSNVLATKAVEKLEERKIDIAQAYFGQVMEEVEQIDELKKTTLASYVKKASHDVATKSALVRGHANKSEEERQKMNFTGARKHDEFSNKMFKKSWKRREGIAKAADKLAKE